MVGLRVLPAFSPLPWLGRGRESATFFAGLLPRGGSPSEEPSMVQPGGYPPLVMTHFSDKLEAESKSQSMKHKTLLLAFLSIAALSVGCDKEKTTTQQIDALQSETKAAAEDMKDYTFAQKAEFTAKMQDQLAAINRDLDQLAAKIDKSSDAVKAEAKPKLQALRDQADKLSQQLDAAKNATESTWADVKAASKKAYSELKDGISQSRQWVSDKIAP